MMTGAAFDFIAGFGRVIGSSVSKQTKAILSKVVGIGPLDPDTEDDEAGELADEAETFGALGVVSRPLPPSKIGNRDVHCEALYMRSSDGLVPVSWRDLRLDSALSPTPSAEIAPGTTSLAGYGGGFVSLGLTDSNSGSKKASIGVSYIPYQFDASGVATKSHTIISDPTPGNESISVIHGDGLCVTLSSEGILLRADSNTWGVMKPGTFLINAASIVLQGNVSLGANPATAVPLLAGPASPPSPSVFVSAV
jgi:hypothetical protein